MAICTVANCVKREKARGLCSMHYARAAAGRDMGAPDKRAMTYDELFRKNVGNADEKGCRNWLGGKDSDGYGLFTAKGMATVRAHRYAFQKNNGPVDGLMVCHHCDNRACVEPAHLFAGTAGDNSRDMVAKGRSMRGSINPKARLTEQAVIDIRSSSAPTAELAVRYEVSVSAITKARKCDMWKHVR